MTPARRRPFGRLASRLRRLTRRHPLLYRLRYAWITELGGVDWGAPPDDAWSEPSAVAPAAFRSVVERVGLDGTASFDQMRRLAFDLSRDHPRGPGLGVDSIRALEAIYSGGVGVCSDYSQVFLALCRTAGIPCREWGLTSTLEGPGIGHAVTEVFVDEYDAWVFLDPFISVYATSRGSEVPLSMCQLVDLTCSGRSGEIEIRPIDGQAVGPEWYAGYVDRYFHAEYFYFLLTNNDVFAQDRFLRWSGRIPTPLLHTGMLLAGSYQRFHVYTNEQNRDLVAPAVGRNSKFGRQVAVTAVVASAAAAAAIVGLSMLFGGD